MISFDDKVYIISSQEVPAWVRDQILGHTHVVLDIREYQHGKTSSQSIECSTSHHSLNSFSGRVGWLGQWVGWRVGYAVTTGQGGRHHAKRDSSSSDEVVCQEPMEKRMNSIESGTDQSV
jgi:hypothetical protein